MRPMFVLASRLGGRLSARAIRQTSSIALGRPRLAQEWPPGPLTAMRARRLPTASTATWLRPWPSSASTELRPQLGAGGTRAREVAEPLLADRERHCEALQAAFASHLLDDLDRAHDGGSVVAHARAAHAPALEHGLVRHLAREDRVDMHQQQHARTRVVEAPDQAAGGVRVTPSRHAPKAPQEPFDPLTLVERRRRHARKREQVFQGMVHGAHAARTLSPRLRQAAIAPGRPAPVRARNVAAASIAASTLNPRSRACAISITCSTASVL